ncbi:hypothetical protein BCR37DRAFT_381150, partial [Protomyces lactucae-debilis]
MSCSALPLISLSLTSKYWLSGAGVAVGVGRRSAVPEMPVGSTLVVGLSVCLGCLGLGEALTRSAKLSIALRPRIVFMIAEELLNKWREREEMEIRAFIPEERCLSIRPRCRKTTLFVIRPINKGSGSIAWHAHFPAADSDGL